MKDASSSPASFFFFCVFSLPPYFYVHVHLFFSFFFRLIIYTLVKDVVCLRVVHLHATDDPKWEWRWWCTQRPLRTLSLSYFPSRLCIFFFFFVGLVKSRSGSYKCRLRDHLFVIFTFGPSRKSSSYFLPRKKSSIIIYIDLCSLYFFEQYFVLLLTFTIFFYFIFSYNVYFFFFSVK